jgi:PKD repeat protein
MCRYQVPWVASALLLASILPLDGATPLQRPSALRIIVIQGEDAVNVIQQKTAIAPIVEVRDSNDLPVAGVTVTFTINSASNASFATGAKTFAVTTNAAGRAAASAITPLNSGPVQIQATATSGGTTATVTITQTNVLTPPQAAAAGSGGGISGLAIAGIVAGVGGGAAALLVTQSDASPSSGSGVTTGGTSAPAPTPAPIVNRPPVVTAPTATPGTAIVGIEVAFLASATDAEGDQVSYAWDFGDGETSTQASPNHVFQRAGVFMVRVTVRDRDGADSAEAPITVKTLTGDWCPLSCNFENGRLRLVQNGTTVTGTMFSESSVGGRTVSGECPLSGSVRSTKPQVVLVKPRCTVPGQSGFFQSSEHRMDPGPDGNVMNGVLASEGGTSGTLPWLRR